MIPKVTKVSNRLEEVVQKLPAWQQSIVMLLNIFRLFDVGVFVLFDKTPNDPLVANTEGTLERMSTLVNGDFEYVTRYAIAIH